MSLVDNVDRRILELLQQNARTTNAAIAEEVGLSGPSVLERIRKLEQRGVIQGYAAQVNPEVVDRKLTAFIRLMVAYDDRFDSGLNALREDADVLECYNVTGDDCLIVKTRVRDPAALEAMLRRVRSHLTVQRSVTMIALAAVKENAPLDVWGEAGRVP